MHNSRADRRLPLGLLPDDPTPRPYDCLEEVLRTRHYGCRTAGKHPLDSPLPFGAKGRPDHDGLHTCVEPRGGHSFLSDFCSGRLLKLIDTSRIRPAFKARQHTLHEG